MAAVQPALLPGPQASRPSTSKPLSRPATGNATLVIPDSNPLRDLVMRCKAAQARSRRRRQNNGREQGRPPVGDEQARDKHHHKDAQRDLRDNAWRDHGPIPFPRSHLQVRLVNDTCIAQQFAVIPALLIEALELLIPRLYPASALEAEIDPASGTTIRLGVHGDPARRTFCRISLTLVFLQLSLHPHVNLGSCCVFEFIARTPTQGQSGLTPTAAGTATMPGRLVPIGHNVDLNTCRYPRR